MTSLSFDATQHAQLREDLFGDYFVNINWALGFRKIFPSNPLTSCRHLLSLTIIYA